MKRRKFFMWLMICGIIFAVMAGGGCGGSKGADVAIPNHEGGSDTERIYDPSDSLQAISIPKDNEIAAIVLLEDVFALLYELSADGTIERINQRGLYTMAVSGDFDQNTAKFSGNETLSFSSNDLRPKYQAGAVMCIISPTEEAVSALLEELGETPNFTLSNASEGLELYAVARDKDSSGKSHMFTYQIPSRKSFRYANGEIVILSSDISADIGGNTPGKSSDDIPYVPTGTTSSDIELIEKRYQLQRIGDFFRWCADGIDSRLAEIEANSAAVKAAFRAALDASDLASFSSAYNQVRDFSYTKTFEPFGNDNGGRYNRTIHRITTGRYTVYSCHSFTNGSDYYLVQAKLESTPDYGEDLKQQDYTDGSPPFWTHYHHGFTNYLINSAYIEGTDSNIAVLKTVPSDSIPKTYTKSESMGWSLGGTIGGSYVQTPGFGGNLGLTYSVSHNQTVNYSTQNWTIENQTDIATPKFNALFIREENDGEPHVDRGFFDLDAWQDLKVDEAAAKRIEYTAEWIWEVKKDFWQNRDNVKIIVNPIIGERFAHGWGLYQRDYFVYIDEHGSENNGKAVTIDVSLSQDLGAPSPAHIYVSRSGFEASSAGSDDVSFELLCNSNWKAESDSDWCVLKYDTTGTDTGANPERIHFRVEPFKTLTGENKKRRATITITELLPNNRTGQTVKIAVSQLPPDSHINITSSTDLTANDEGGTMSFNLKAAGKWTASSDSDWCVIDPSCTSGDATGSGEKVITFTVAKFALTERKATIKITDDIGNYINVYVNQGKLVFQASENAFTVFLSYGMTITQNFTLTCNRNWTVESDAHWCVIDDSCKSGGNTGSNGKQITFRVNDDDYYTAGKDTTITVKAFLSDGSTKVIKIDVARILLPNK